MQPGVATTRIAPQRLSVFTTASRRPLPAKKASPQKEAATTQVSTFMLQHASHELLGQLS